MTLAEHYMRLAAPIPDCNGVSDCYFCAAAASTRRLVEGRD